MGASLEKFTPSHFNTPDWTIQPSLKEIVSPNGKPTFEFLHTPEKNPYSLSRVGYSLSEKKLRLPPEVAEKKQELIQLRKKTLDEKYQAALRAWEEGGKKGDLPEKPTFFDGKLVRAVPSEIHSSNTEPAFLLIPVGTTSYFDYVATRDLDESKYSEESIAYPLAMCGVLTGIDSQGQEYMIYTTRTMKVEQYQGNFHVIGGMLAKPDQAIASPTDAWVKELTEEAGIKPEEVEVQGSLGILKDTYWPHLELTHKAKLTVPLDTLFQKGEDAVTLKPVRETDKEVMLRAVPWKPEFIRALVLGEKISGGDQDLRPWVPTGLGNLLLAGKVDFGKEWFDSVLDEYQRKISLLNLQKPQ